MRPTPLGRLALATIVVGFVLPTHSGSRAIRREPSTYGNVAALDDPSQIARPLTLVDFEPFAQHDLTTEVPGLSFKGARVLEGAMVGNSSGVPLWAASSGLNAVFTSWSEVRFATPVRQVGLYATPSFVSAPLTATEGGVGYFQLRAYDADGRAIGEVRAPYLSFVPPGDEESLDRLTPVFVGLASEMWIHRIVITRDGNQPNGGSTLFYDDLMFSPKSDDPPAISSTPTAS